MSMVLSIPGVAFATFCVWLTVRVVNRRERWAKWTAVGLLVGLPVFYVGSFGPACWIAATPRIAGATDMPRMWMRFYFPIGAVIDYTRSQDNKEVKQWITWGAKKGGRVIVPVDVSGKNWYGFAAE